MRFSTMVVQTTPQDGPERYAEIIEQVLLAEQLGYHRVWLTCHHFTSFSRPSSMLMLSHLAALTSRIRLGLGVVVLPLEHPLRVAEDAAVLDHLSGGRVDVGVGRGIQPEAFRGFDIPMQEASARYQEALEILRKAWTQERFSHEGRFWNVPELSVLPRPVQEPHPPIWQVGVSPASIERAAASGLNGLIGTYMNTLEEVHGDLELWSRHLPKAGDGRERPLLAHNELVYVARTDDLAEAESRPSGLWYSRSAGKTWQGEKDGDTGLPDDYEYWRWLARRTESLDWDDLRENRSLIGSPETVLAKVRQLADWGVDDLIVFSSFGGMPHEQTCRSLRLFAEHVMPELA
jgi:alkanesulfonate monooxygenase SsuD/methylene tetrahydromethanopterin reductase-like flavin-dependent oxidoreductase (luciferase family)